MKRNSYVFVAALAAVMTLAGCGTTSSSKALPSTNEEVVEKVASTGAIATTSKNVVLTQGANNTIPTGQSVVVANKFTVQVEGGTCSPTIVWTMADTKNTTKKAATPDATHDTFVLKTPAFGASEVKTTLTGKITWADFSKDVTYDITIPASTIAPTEYVKLEDVYTQVIKNKKTPFVTTYGYVVYCNGDGGTAYIQAGEYGAQLYGTSAFKDKLVVGDLIQVTGNGSNYNGLELSGVTSIVKSTRTDIASVVKGELTKAIIDGMTTGTKYDNQAMFANDAVFVSFSTDTASFKTSDGGAFAVYLKSGVEKTIRDGFVTLLTAAKAGEKYNLNGIQSYYSSGSMVELLPWAVSDIVKVA